MSVNSHRTGLIPAQFLSHLPPPHPQSGCPDDVSSNQSCSQCSQLAGSLLCPLREGRHFRKNWKILLVTHSTQLPIPHLCPSPCPSATHTLTPRDQSWKVLKPKKEETGIIALKASWAEPRDFFGHENPGRVLRVEHMPEEVSLGMSPARENRYLESPAVPFPYPHTLCSRDLTS